MIKYLKSLFTPKVEIRYVPMTKAVQWTNEHARQLATVLNSEFGKVLMDHMQGWQAEANAKLADNDTMTTDYKRGTANGLNQTIRLIRQYSQFNEQVITPDEITPENVEAVIRNRIDRLGNHGKFVL